MSRNLVSLDPAQYPRLAHISSRRVFTVYAFAAAAVSVPLWEIPAQPRYSRSSRSK